MESTDPLNNVPHAGGRPRWLVPLIAGILLLVGVVCGLVHFTSEREEPRSIHEEPRSIHEEALARAGKRLTLPRSTSPSQVTDVVTITISPDALGVQDGALHKDLATIENGSVSDEVKRDGASGFLIKPLLKRLHAIADRHRAAAKVKGGAPFAGEIALAAHNATPYRLLSEVMYTAGQAKFRKFRLLTRGAGGAVKNLNVYTPRDCDSDNTDSVCLKRPDEASGKMPLSLTVAISYKGFIVAARSGIIKGDDGQLPTVKCRGPLERSRCPARCTERVDKKGQPASACKDSYDYISLRSLLQELKKKFPGERQVILAADRLIPYQVVINTLDSLRGTTSDECDGLDGCLFDHAFLSAGVQ